MLTILSNQRGREAFERRPAPDHMTFTGGHMATTDLIPVFTATIGDSTVSSVDGRRLHAFLENGDHFSTWAKERIQQYGFVENQDFIIYSATAEKRGRPTTEYSFSLDMAKELAMVERNEKGKRARQYFIECERRLQQGQAQLQNTFPIPKTFPEALRLAALQYERAEKAEAELAAAQPAIQFHDEVAATDGNIEIADAAKTLLGGQRGAATRLREFLIEQGWLTRRSNGYQSTALADGRGWMKTVPKKIGNRTIVYAVLTGKGLVRIRHLLRADELFTSAESRARLLPAPGQDLAP